MISKKISREKKTSDFERLGQYLVNAQSSQDEVMWTRTAEYVVDLKATDLAEEKVLWYRITNCEAEVPAMAIAEVQLTQSQNTRAKTDKTYHLVISFPEGEIPSRAQLEDTEDQMCKALGFEAHQRISAVHQDTDNIHLHLAINKVHPDRLTLHDPPWDYYTRDRVCRDMEKKHGLTVDNGIGQGKRYGKEQEMNAHSEKETLWQWIQDQAKTDLVQAGLSADSWQALHQQFAEHGLLIKPRGAGLVVGTLDGSVHLKASAIDKSLSFKCLSKRLGQYQAPEQMAQKTERSKSRYQAEPRMPDDEARSLYAEFQAQKQNVWDQRKVLKAQQQAEKEEFKQQLKAWHLSERLSIQTSTLSGLTKRQAYQQLSQERQQLWEAQRQKEAEQRKTLHTPPSWEQFLIQTAERGNSKALELLRNRRQKQWRMAKALLTADNLEAARNLVYPHLKPIAKRNGDLIYRVQDGGSVTDERTKVRVDEVTAGSAFFALSLASERFKGQPLDVQGESAFKEQVVQFAAQYRMAVTFKDEQMEAERQRLCKLMENQAKAASEKSSPALEAFITQRNKLGEQIKDILPHRLWTKQDSGDLMFQGRRNLTDGTQAVLLQKGQEMLVKPIQSHEFQGVKVGQRITLSEQGQLSMEGKGQGYER